MQEILQRVVRLKYHFALGGMLVLASALCLVLEKVHARVNGAEVYLFLVFNLALAWIPFAAAALAYLVRPIKIVFYLLMPICIVVWLIFFPNAAYLLTDFQHLSYTNSNAPLWFDVVVMIWFAWTGLLLGITSLYLMQELVTRLSSTFVGWVFAFSATILSSVGVYMGRFLRWNSWDLLYDPIPIARDVYAIVRHPMANLPTYVFTILFTLLFLFIYIAIHLFGGMMNERKRQ